MDIEQLEKLVELKEKGILTQEQFEIEKKKILQTNRNDHANSPKSLKINWKNLGISFFIAIIYMLLISFISAVFQYFVESKEGILIQLVIMSAVIFTFYAIKKETYRYKYCSSAWAIFFYIMFCAPLAIWLVIYQFLQIKTDNVSLMESKRNKVLTNIGTVILIIITICTFFSLYVQIQITRNTLSAQVKTSFVINNDEGNTQELTNEFNLAVRSGELDKVKQLIGKGVNINPNDNDCILEDAPLLLSIYDGTGEYANPESVEIAKLLINSGADVNIICNTKSGNDVNPLSLAIDDLQMLTLLIKAGADVNAKVKRSTEPDMTMLVYALYYTENPQVISELLHNGANYNEEYAGNKIVNLCLYVTNVKTSDENYKKFSQNCNSLLQYVKLKDPKILYGNSLSSVVLPEEFNKKMFKNIESKEFQGLLKKGIEQYLVKYLRESGNQPYSGNLDEYLLLSTPYIPLPEKPAIFNNYDVEFTYGAYEIAPGYIGSISFSIPKGEVKQFLIEQ